ncbi:BRO family protein [Streptomyces sp. NPDC047042]|uniref:BRO family protein n=1 Tax=Streptomyces sp. NPDC047042 TaxID=3154807 RepID=UPI0033DE38D3
MYAATEARVQKLTLPDGTHWFPAVDVCKNLEYTYVGSALRNVADATNFASVESVLLRHRLSVPAAREQRRDMKGLVNGCTKPEAEPVENWVSEVIATIQRDDPFSLEPSLARPPATGPAAKATPQQVAEALQNIAQSLRFRHPERKVTPQQLLAPLEDEEFRPRMLLKRGCMRQTGCTADGAPCYVLP